MVKKGSTQGGASASASEPNTASGGTETDAGMPTVEATDKKRTGDELDDSSRVDRGSDELQDMVGSPAGVGHDMETGEGSSLKDTTSKRKAEQDVDPDRENKFLAVEGGTADDDVAISSSAGASQSDHGMSSWIVVGSKN